MNVTPSQFTALVIAGVLIVGCGGESPQSPESSTETTAPGQTVAAKSTSSESEESSVGSVTFTIESTDKEHPNITLTNGTFSARIAAPW